MLARADSRLSVTRSFALSASYVVAMAWRTARSGSSWPGRGRTCRALLQTPNSRAGDERAVRGARAVDVRAVRTATAAGLDRAAGGDRRQQGIDRRRRAARVRLRADRRPLRDAAAGGRVLFVAQTGEVVRGSLALFALGLGMGLPLIAFGVLGAGVLPRSGAWLSRVKHVFGFVFIGLAIWMASRVVPVALTATAWGAVFIAIGLYFDVPRLGVRGTTLAVRQPRPRQGPGVLDAIALRGMRPRHWRCALRRLRTAAAAGFDRHGRFPSRRIRSSNRRLPGVNSPTRPTSTGPS